MGEVKLFAGLTFPEIYERVLVRPLFQPFAEAVVERLAPAPGVNLIDVACGTGIVARLVRNRVGADARVVGIDVAPPMLAVARTADPSIEWREGNATALPFGDGEFSRLTCHQGLQFFSDRAAAVREMRRVLAPHGRAAIACWRPLEDVPAIAELNAIAERHVGPIADARHSLGNPDSLRALLSDEGFSNVVVETFSHNVRFSDGALFATLNAMAVIGMTERGKALDDERLGELARQVGAESQPVIARYSKDGELVFQLSTLIATARA